MCNHNNQEYNCDMCPELFDDFEKDNDFDEETLETLHRAVVIGPIAAARRKKEIQDNTFFISRVNYDHSTNEQVEAWLTKFDQVIIDEINEPYKFPLTKKEIGLKIGKSLYSMATKKNMQKGIGMIQKTTDMISQFGSAFGNNKTNLSFDGPRKNNGFKQSKQKTDTGFLTSKPKRNSLKIWSDEPKHQIKPKRRRSRRKPVQAKQSNFLTGGKKVSFSSNKRVKFF